MTSNLKKGQILVVKVPPFFDREYFYEVMAAGGKVIRASLYHSPKVKKHWTQEEYDLLCEHGMIRTANAADLQRLAKLKLSSEQSDSTGNGDEVIEKD